MQGNVVTILYTSTVYLIYSKSKPSEIIHLRECVVKYEITTNPYSQPLGQKRLPHTHLKYN